MFDNIFTKYNLVNLREKAPKSLANQNFRTNKETNINIYTSFNCLIYSVECIKIPHFNANWNCDGVKRFVRVE